MDYIFTQESTYGPSQNRLTFVESQDFDGDGTSDLITHEQRYHEAGFLLYQAVRQDGDRDGCLEYLSFLSDTYTPEGRLSQTERRFSTGTANLAGAV